MLGVHQRFSEAGPRAFGGAPPLPGRPELLLPESGANLAGRVVVPPLKLVNKNNFFIHKKGSKKRGADSVKNRTSLESLDKSLVGS